MFGHLGLVKISIEYLCHRLVQDTVVCFPKCRAFETTSKEECDGLVMVMIQGCRYRVLYGALRLKKKK